MTQVPENQHAEDLRRRCDALQDYVARARGEAKCRAMLAAAPKAEPAATNDCTRSHPHEAMSAECQVRAVIAEMRSKKARGAEATEHELGEMADRLTQALDAYTTQPAPAAQGDALEQARLQYESIEQMPTELDIDYGRIAETEDELRSLEGERDEATAATARATKAKNRAIRSAWCAGLSTPPAAHKERAMNPYESGAVIDMTHASTGADALRVAHAAAVADAVAAERERCAQVCLEMASIWLGDPVLAGMADGAEDCADAIRAGDGEQK